jgi:hypothetical protein
MTTPPADQPLSMVRAAALERPEPVLASIPLGTVDAAAIADVDPAGWVQLRGATWSLDWWVGAEDRWHHPAVEAAVRQRCLDDAPLVETAMRVPGGDVLHRAYGARATSPASDDELWDDSAVVVEVENLTSVPVALALVLRPLGLAGAGRLGRVEVDGTTVRVDGTVVAVLSRPVARAAHGPLGSVAAALADGVDTDVPLQVEAGDGHGEVALVVPLPHTATVRVMLPRVAPRPKRRWFGGTAAGEPGGVFEAPDVEAVGKGWAAHTRDGVRLDLGEPLLDRLVPSSVRSLVLGSGDEVLERAQRAVQVTELLARTAMTEPLGPLARALVAEQRLGGAVRLGDGGDATAALLFAAAPLLSTGAEQWIEQLVGPVAKSVHLVRKGGALEQPSTWRAGAEALAAVAPALRVVGQPEVAEDAESAAALVAGRLADAAASSASDEDDLLARLVALRARVRAGDVEAVAQLLELARLGEPGAVGDRYDELGTPTGALGYDPGAVAARASAAIDLAVLDAPEGPALLPVWPEQWFGRGIEAHGVRTRFGRVSFGVRWHGNRPAVLWEVQAHPGADAERAPVLSSPGLDPTWRGEGWSGEALLAAVDVPAELLAEQSPGPTPGLQPRQVDLPSAPGEGDSFL